MMHDRVEMNFNQVWEKKKKKFLQLIIPYSSLSQSHFQFLEFWNNLMEKIHRIVVVAQLEI
jgi:hypothetical protein